MIPPDMPEPVGDEPIVDPLGGPDAMIQRIEVRGFGSVDSEEVFLKVEGSSRTAKKAETVLGFLVIEIEDPFVTLGLDGREWRLSTANQHIKNDGDLFGALPVSPRVIGPDMVQKFQPIHSGHFNIRKHKMKVYLRHLEQSIGTVLCASSMIAFHC